MYALSTRELLSTIGSCASETLCALSSAATAAGLT